MYGVLETAGAQPGVPEQPRVPVRPPMVYVEPAWAYRHVARDLKTEPPLAGDELGTLGAEGWELAAAVIDGRTAHYYFKRPLQ